MSLKMRVSYKGWFNSFNMLKLNVNGVVTSINIKVSKGGEYYE